MSWSISTKPMPQSLAARDIREAFQADNAYKSDGAHKTMMDALADAAEKIAAAAPTDSEVFCSSYGHANTDGTGQASITVQVQKKAPPLPEPEPAPAAEPVQPAAPAAEPEQPPASA